MNKLQWNLNQNSYISIQENAFENVVSEMASILFRPQCVDELMLSSLHHIKIQILILMLPYVHEYAIWVLMGWILWWLICKEKINRLLSRVRLRCTWGRSYWLKPRSHLAVRWSRPLPTRSFPTTADLNFSREKTGPLPTSWRQFSSF